MSDLNIDENKLNEFKSLLGNQNVSKLLENISPNTLSQVSSIIQNSNSSSVKCDINTSNNQSQKSGDLDIETILKLKNIIDSANIKDDNRSNLINSLKPYLRKEKKEKIDQYSSMLNMAKIAEILNNTGNSNGK